MKPLPLISKALRAAGRQEEAASPAPAPTRGKSSSKHQTLKVGSGAAAWAPAAWLAGDEPPSPTRTRAERAGEEGALGLSPASTPFFSESVTSESGDWESSD